MASRFPQSAGINAWLQALCEGAYLNSATTNSQARAPALAIVSCALAVCVIYSALHFWREHVWIGVFALISAAFCGRIIQLTLANRLDTFSLLGFIAAQTIALSLTSYEFGLRGLILVFPLTAGTFYFLEFKLAALLSALASIITLVCSLHVIDVALALRFAVALLLSILFCACFSSVAVQQFRRSRYEALHDFLTQIPNRRGFLHWLQQELQHARTRKHDLVLYFIDLDKFKQVNDEFGHTTGDELLKAFAARLLNAIRTEDIIKRGYAIANIGRLSGDEFAFATYGVKDEAAGQLLAERLTQVMSRTYFVNQRTIDITISIGFCFAAAVGFELEELIDCADRRMYQHKYAAMPALP